MQILRIFDKKDYSEDIPGLVHEAVFAIIVKDNRYALVKSEFKACFKFPGGGIDTGESHVDALIRIIHKKTGLAIIPDSTRTFGMIKEMRQDSKKNEIFEQNSYYYFAEVSDLPMSLDAYEAEVGYHLEFVPLSIALEINEGLACRMPADFLHREVYIMRLLCLSIKTMDRPKWKRVTQREYTYANISNDDFEGAIGLLKLCEVRAPLFVDYYGEKIKIVEKNYKWLQFAFQDKYYWLSVMFDEKDNIIQYYFDITYGNFIKNNGESWFFDLYLDVVMQPDGRVLLLDEDELNDALESNAINKCQYDLARNTALKLIEDVTGRESELAAFCMKYYVQLR